MFWNRKDGASKYDKNTSHKDIKFSKLAHKRVRRNFFSTSHICCERKMEKSQSPDYTED